MNKKKINVLVFIGRFGRDSGGAQRVIINQIKTSDGTAIKYHVCYISGDGTARDELPDGVVVEKLHVKGSLDFSIPKKLARLIRKLEIDIVHSHSNLAGIWSRITLLFNSKVSIVATEQNSHQHYRNLTGLVNGLTLLRANRVSCVSESVYQSFFTWEKMILNKKNISTVHNAIAFDDFSSIKRDQSVVRDVSSRRALGATSDATVLIGNVARFSSQKNQIFLLNEFAEVAKVVGNARLVFIGDGELRAEIVQHVKQLNLESQVIFAGKRSDMLEVYRHIDIFVLPSLFEGFSLALLEGMASGLPIICSDIPEILEATGTSCFASSPIDQGELAQHMIEVCSDADLRFSSGEEARKRVLNLFNAQQMCEKYEYIYESLVDDHRSVQSAQ